MALITQSEFFSLLPAERPGREEKDDVTLADLVLDHTCLSGCKPTSDGSWRRTITRSTRALMRPQGKSC